MTGLIKENQLLSRLGLMQFLLVYWVVCVSVYILFYMVVLTVYVKLLENIYEHLFLMSLQTKI